MYADFMWVAADQLFNQIGKARHMYGGDGRRASGAAQQGRDGHRLRLAALDGPRRGLRDRGRAGGSSRPATPYDYVGLMNTALRCQDPVVVLEHVDLYTSSGPGPVDDLDYCLPVGKAAVRRDRGRTSPC